MAEQPRSHLILRVKIRPPFHQRRHYNSVAVLGRTVYSGALILWHEGGVDMWGGAH